MFYKDLKDPDYATTFCVYHRRFRCVPPPRRTCLIVRSTDFWCGLFFFGSSSCACMHEALKERAGVPSVRTLLYVHVCMARVSDVPPKGFLAP